jgi:pimeloyl-ACP methyl ester carboxylesterase
MTPKFLTSLHGYPIAYETLAGSEPAVLFLTGFKSDMMGQKAQALHEFCAREGIGFTRFDYGGHGASGGTFEEGTIGSWLDDATAVLDQVTTGKQIVIGSSMGGWIAMLLAKRRPARVCGLIGIAAAPDFTERLIWDVTTDAQKEQLARDGFFSIPNCYGAEPYNITRTLIEEGRKHLLLNSKSINLPCPAHFIHGTADEDVPVALGKELAKRVPFSKLTLVEGGNHRLSEPEHLELLCQTLAEMRNKLR